jgi:outer membrane protein assembly factor BamB
MNQGGLIPEIRSAAVLIALAACWGCGDAVERSEQAAAFPATNQDPREAAGEVGSEQWPGWRGVRSSGISPSVNLPIEWSADSGQVWRVAVPGEGNSSPVVWNDAILLTSAIPAGEASSLALLCFDRVDGSLRWRADASKATGRTHAKNGHASASPAVDGDQIYVNFGAAGLIAFDMAGAQLWSVDLGALDHVWGAASSPVLFKRLVIQLCDQEQGSYLAAFDRLSGAEIWRTPRDSYGCWTTPVLVTADSPAGPRTELVVNGTGTSDSEGGWVIAYDPATGKELWRAQGTTDIVCPTAIAGGGLVFSTSGRNGSIFAIQPGGAGDVGESRIVWRLRRGGPYVPTGLVYRNRLYLIGDGGVLTSYNAGDGELVWRKRLGGTFTASLVAGDGKIYAGDERGKMYVVAAADEFELLAMNEMDERLLATPAISRGEVIIRTAQHLTLIPTALPSAEADIADAEVVSPSDRAILVEDIDGR